MGKKRNKSTIGGNNPLDSVVPRGDASAAQRSGRRGEERGVGPASEVSPAKERLTVHLPKPLIDRVKNAVYWTPGLTLASLGQRALEAEVERMEQERGEMFPQRADELRGGRPMK